MSTMEFRSGPRITFDVPDDVRSTTTLRLRVDRRPDVIPGQIVAAGEALARGAEEGDRPAAARAFSPIAASVHAVRMCPPEANEPDAQACFQIDLTPGEPTAPTTLARRSPRDLSAEAWRTALRESGPWGQADGDAWNLIGQLENGRGRIDSVVCVVADPFPPHADQSSLAESFADSLAEGIGTISRWLAVPGLIAVARGMNLPATKLAARRNGLKVVQLASAYPSAHARMIRRTLGGAPLLLRPWPAIRLGRWVTHEQLDLVQPVTLAWPEAEHPLEYRWAWPGQPLSTVHRRLQRYLEGAEPMHLLFGDPLTGQPVRSGTDTDDPPLPHGHVTITMVAAARERAAVPCIACGWCVDACPVSLNPSRMFEQLERGRSTDRLKANVERCIDCGLCSYVCPSALPLAQSFKSARFIATPSPEPARKKQR